MCLAREARGQRLVDQRPVFGRGGAGRAGLFGQLGEVVHRVRLTHEGRLATFRLGLSRAALMSRKVGRIILSFRERYPEVDAERVLAGVDERFERGGGPDRDTRERLRVDLLAGGRGERQISGGAGFLFKGEGVYITAYRSAATKSKAKAEPAIPTEAIRPTP